MSTDDDRFAGTFAELRLLAERALRGSTELARLLGQLAEQIKRRGTESGGESPQSGEGTGR